MFQLLFFRWEKQLEAGGPHKLKLQKISEGVLQKFMAAKRAHLTVHDLDIRRWALAIARNVNCSNFKASGTWLLNFKRAHKIVPRKITKFVSKADLKVEWKCS